MRILGIDPGSRITGYGVIDIIRNRSRYVESGAIHTTDERIPQRLKEIFDGILTVLDHFEPTEIAIERLFLHRNPDSALKLGQARGAAICAVMSREIAISEYSPAEIKKAVVGKGNAKKEQVQHMITALLQLSATPQSDAADALAVALCHFHTGGVLNRIPQATASRRGRYR
ncbi:MAG: crossover junction endodeoxyribonuclease RuvC [Gammaproteobacteria bacterium]|nr:crossover junction endodeoxyribonuclease RuvC [Gammaproteobacteria bacterium]